MPLIGIPETIIMKNLIFPVGKQGMWNGVMIAIQLDCHALRRAGGDIYAAARHLPDSRNQQFRRAFLG